MSTACGVPVVGSGVGYLADWSPDAATAVPPGSPQALADAIERILADPERRRATADAAHRWSAAHDVDSTARQFEALYRRVASTRAASSPLTV